MSRLIDVDNLLTAFPPEENEIFRTSAVRGTINACPTVDAVPVVRCRDCKHNPKFEWFGCPMASLSEKQRPETAWCWKGEREGR